MAKSGDDGSRWGRVQCMYVCVCWLATVAGVVRDATMVVVMVVVVAAVVVAMVVVKFIPDASHLITLLRCINCESAASTLQHIKAAVGTIEAREYK